MTDGHLRSSSIGNNKSRTVLVVCILSLGFAAGWVAKRHVILKQRPLASSEQVSLGDAPQPVRSEVLKQLKAFQAGYASRDPQKLPAFMDQLFPRDKNIVVLGTDPNEWITGYDSISRFIDADWKNWGDVRLDVEHPVICTSGNVAWLATSGALESGRNSRPLRFTAILVLDDGRWTFRHVQFQWDDRQATLRDFLHLENYSRLHWQ
jgi:SnoaL-like domain